MERWALFYIESSEKACLFGDWMSVGWSVGWVLDEAWDLKGLILEADS